MDQPDPAAGDPAARRPAGDTPRFAPPGSDHYTPSGLEPVHSAPPPFDPTAPITGPGSSSDRTHRPSESERPPAPFRSRRRLAPTLITIGVLVLGLIVIGGGVLISRYRDQHAGASTGPAASSAPSTVTSTTAPPGAGHSAVPSGSSIPFSSRRAGGTLSVLGHQWTTVGRIDPSNGTYLALDVEIRVDRGAMYYSPAMFEVFDSVGNVYEDDQNVNQRPLLSTGYLSAGQVTRGWVSFDLKRGETTLLLAGPDANPMAALKVPG